MPYISIAENIFLGREPLNNAGFIDYKIMEERAGSRFDKLEFDADVRQKISSLRIGNSRLWK